MHRFLKGYLALHGYWVLFLRTFLEGEAEYTYGFRIILGMTTFPAAEEE